MFVWPSTLAFDHGAATSPRIAEFMDWHNLLTVGLYGRACTCKGATRMVCACPCSALFLVLSICVAAGLVAYGGWSWARAGWGRGLWCAAWAAMAFLPASNLVLHVGTEMSERLLYLPR